MRTRSRFVVVPMIGAIAVLLLPVHVAGLITGDGVFALLAGLGIVVSLVAIVAVIASIAIERIR